MGSSRKPYLGSIRFFKHLIVLTIGLMIVVPTIFSIDLHMKNAALQSQLAELAAVKEDENMELEGKPQGPENVKPKTEAPPWESLYPNFYAEPGNRSTVEKEKVAYLTFDDGPSAQTPKVLEVLDRYNVKATFFVIGKTDEQSKEWMKDIVAAGHTIGIHTYTHDYKKVYASVENFLEDYNKMYNLIYETTGVYPQISRFPGGSINSYNTGNYKEIISELLRRGFVYYDWNVSTGDAAKGSVPAKGIAANALSKVNKLDRAIILAHDAGGKGTTVEALPAIIEGYTEAGFTFEALTPEVVPVVYGYPN